MRTRKHFWISMASLLLFLFNGPLWSQTYRLDSAPSRLKVAGTSNIHDWEITAKQMQGDLNAVVKNGKITGIDQLNFAVVSESLESGKSGMDKNTFKALKTDSFKRIVFQLHKVESITCNGDTCEIKTTGDLSIAGVKKPVALTFKAVVANGMIRLSGNKKINMSDFKIDPPTAMFGTITTGDQVEVIFDVNFRQ